MLQNIRKLAGTIRTDVLELSMTEHRIVAISCFVGGAFALVFRELMQALVQLLAFCAIGAGAYLAWEFKQREAEDERDGISHLRDNEDC